jgi:D-sedoheptulose 7-phosphate isomerase
MANPGKEAGFDVNAFIRDALTDSIATKTVLREEGVDVIRAIAERFADAVGAGHKLLFCGNGGSAADAQHLAAELLVRLRPDIDRQPFPAIALSMDMSTMTACSNDYGYETLYERMVQALGNEGDVLVGITTSGKSASILRALRRARELGIHTVGFLGSGGGPALQLCDLALVVPSATTSRIQESHITVGHIVMELVEEHLRVRGLLRS